MLAAFVLFRTHSQGACVTEWHSVAQRRKNLYRTFTEWEKRTQNWLKDETRLIQSCIAHVLTVREWKAFCVQTTQVCLELSVQPGRTCSHVIYCSRWNWAQTWSKISHRFKETKAITLFPSCCAIWKRRSFCSEGEHFHRDWSVIGPTRYPETHKHSDQVCT